MARRRCRSPSPIGSVSPSTTARGPKGYGSTSRWSWLRARGGPLLLVTITPATQIYGDLAVGRAQLAMLPLGVGAPPPGAAGAARRIGRVHGGFGYIAVTRRGRKVTKLSEFVGTAVGVPRGSCCFPRLSDDPTIEKVPMESEAAPLMTLHGRINASVVLDLDFAHYIDFHGFDPEEFRVARLYDPLEAWIFANDRVDPVIDAKLKDELATTMMKDQIAEMLTRYRISAPPMDGPQVTRIL